MGVESLGCFTRRRLAVSFASCTLPSHFPPTFTFLGGFGYPKSEKAPASQERPGAWPHLTRRYDMRNLKCCSQCYPEGSKPYVAPIPSPKKPKRTNCRVCEGALGPKEPATCRLCRRYERLQKVFGIDRVAYDSMMEAQDGLCAICKCPPRPGRHLSVDHDHLTGEVRALLCNPCNSGIGHLGDSLERAEAAVEYLRKHQ